MTIFLLLITAACLYRIKLIKPINSYNIHYMDLDRTTSIKGIFILLVFLSHASSYLTDLSENILNTPYCIIQGHLGQCIVVMFLLYSGYGVMESIKKKGEGYVNSIPKKRVLKTLYHFDAAVLLFLILGIALGEISDWSISKILLSFIAWDSLGNSNWYIFEILILYLITYIAFKLCKDKQKLALCVVTALSLLCIFVMHYVKEYWWYDTVLCYALGMWFSVYKDKIEGFLHKKAVYYFSALAFSFIAFAVCHFFRENAVIYELSILFFGIVIVLLTMKIDINNKILCFFGKYLFEIYILMRIPMRILNRLGISNVYLFVIISFVVTVILSLIFKKFLEFTDKKLLKL